MRCNNNCCNHRYTDGTCEVSEEVIIGKDGICESYEKGFTYYFYYFTRVMKNSNFICLPDLNDDLRYCIYYLMKCFPIAFSVDDIRGILLLKNTETDELLSSEGILDMVSNIDDEKLEDCIHEFLNEGLPDIYQSEPSKVEYREYGWLSPTGDYYEAKFGEHEKEARNIIERSNWIEEYNDWLCSTLPDSCYSDYGNFLTSVKGYALINDPSGLCRYLVSNHKPLTKEQKDFLYGFFIDMGMTNRAESYLED